MNLQTFKEIYSMSYFENDCSNEGLRISEKDKYLITKFKWWHLCWSNKADFLSKIQEIFLHLQ